MASTDFSKVKAELEALRAENAKLKKKVAQPGIQLKLSEKGCISVYIGARFPVSLYREAWELILDHADEIREFIEDHKDKLPTLADKKKTKEATANKNR